MNIFKGDGNPNPKAIDKLPDPPPWRRFERPGRQEGFDKGEGYDVSPVEIQVVNAALALRRPIMVTGKPGIGKTTLPYAVARELGLGKVLVWPITSRSTLKQGMYDYDAIGRLQDSQAKPGASGAKRPEIEDYVTLGPLGTAMATSKWKRPRVLLIDEIDKADIDLPNDLLHVFEEGAHPIPELIRDAKKTHQVRTSDPGPKCGIKEGYVLCEDFPLTIMTSNNEREFPPAFLRRCLRLELAPPDEKKLVRIVKNRLQLESAPNRKHKALIQDFLKLRDEQNFELATDQLLNAAHLLRHGADISEGELNELRAVLFQSLEGGRKPGDGD